MTAATGHIQILPLTLLGARGNDRTLRHIPVPVETDSSRPDGLISGNVARLYHRMADDLHNGTSTAPTFDDAVELHQLLTTIIRASETGQRLPVAASWRRLP